MQKTVNSRPDIMGTHRSDTSTTPSYQAAYDAFDLSVEYGKVDIVYPVSTINAAFVCCDRHADDPTKLALRYRSLHGQSQDVSFRELMEKSTKFAEALRSLGVQKGDAVAGLLPRTPELLMTILAVWRLGAVYQPLFTAFGPKAIEYRLREAQTKVVITDPENVTKLDDIDCSVTVLTTKAVDRKHTQVVSELLDQQAGVLAPVPCSPDDPFLIMFTSGTTGAAKSLHVPLRGMVAFASYMRDAIGLTAEDRFWNVADPGWAYGLYYAVTGPLALGYTTTFYDGAFSPESTYQIISDLQITNLAGSPTAFRLLMGAGDQAAAAIKGQLRVVSSAGEPLNPEIIRWFDVHLEAPIFDHYGQTELGMVLCNHHGLSHPVHVGSAGFASPGHRVVVVSEDLEELSPGKPGILALDRRRSPQMWFEGYLGRETMAFAGDYYLSGDTVEMNDDGSISFIGRADDVITTSGYRVGPFDVESALIEHEAVLESAVIGKPDPERTEIIKAFIVLKNGYTPSSDLNEEIKLHVKKRLSAHAYPREMEFVQSLPKTPSGKVQRFLLRNQKVAKLKQ